MATITKKNTTTTTTTINTEAMKEENNMANNSINNNSKVNEIVNRVVNITTTPHVNNVVLVKKAGTSYLKINGVIAGVIGGSEKEQEANVACVQFMVDNCDEQEDGRVLAQQCNLITQVMADLEKVNLDDTILLDKVEYIIDTDLKEVYTEGGQCVVNLSEIYPELANVELTKEAVRAILIGELNKHKVPQMADHDEDEDNANDEINITAEKKLSVVDTIKGLRALGMKASWFNVNGIRQMFPICYNGESDLAAFTKIVKDSLDNNKSYLDTILTSCKMKENELNLDDETLVINDINCVIDYTKKELWDEYILVKLASLDDIEYELPNEAVKVMLIERAKAKIEEMQEEDECDYDCDGDCDNCPCYDDCDECEGEW